MECVLARAYASSFPVLENVQHVTVGIADEEAPYAPVLGREWVDDFQAAAERLGVRLVDIVDCDRYFRGDGAARVFGEDLQVRPVGREIAGHPAKSQVLAGKTKEAGIEGGSRIHVCNDQVRDDPHDAHASIMRPLSWRDHTLLTQSGWGDRG